MNLEQTKSAAYEGVATGIVVEAQQWRPQRWRGRPRRWRGRQRGEDGIEVPVV
jgi:hypothetical protein